MLELDIRQQAMLKEMGILLPWPASLALKAKEAAHTLHATQPQHPHAPQTKTDAPAFPPHHVKNQPKPASSRSTKPSHTQPFEAAQTAQVNPQQLHARAQKIARMTWTELEEAASQCTACALCKSRKRTVFSAGQTTAEWMIVGEAPGEQEDKQGLPFVGPAGQLLDRMLAQLNLSRAPQGDQKPVYIANVLKCRPPRNRNPEPEEMAICEPLLKRQIELVQPKIILVVGRFAVQTLLATHEAIGRLRGQVHDYNGIPAIVTYHPAYLLRNPVDKRKSWEDLCLAAQTFSP